MNSKKKLGIFGGSFDPVHLGHITTLSKIKKLHNFDEIIFIPTFIVNSRKKIVATPAQRIKMLEISLYKHSKLSRFVSCGYPKSFNFLKILFFVLRLVFFALYFFLSALILFWSIKNIPLN